MFNSKLLHAAATFVSREETCYYLHGVRVEPDPVHGEP